MNKGWKFWVEKDSFALVWNIPENAREVTLPHDAMIEKDACESSPNGGNTGFRDGEFYTYVKMLDAPEEYRNRTIKIKFEGAYMNALVYVNGQLAGKNPFGYTTFYVDLSDFLNFGEENEIRVQIRNGNMTNSRWYSGGGLYRDVYFLNAGLTYIKEEGVQVTTETIDEDYAAIEVRTEIVNRNHAPQDMIVETVVKDPDGAIVSIDQKRIKVFGNEERVLYQKLTVDDPRLWSAESTALYRYETTLMTEKGEADRCEGTFGIRKLSVDAKRGFRVNGKTVKFRGACIHHDSGLLGAATYEDAQFRQVRKLKEAGFNAIRMSHHPMAPAMLRACDTIGMYVMDETFDMWNRCKSDYDYGLYFQEWWEKDVTAMVRKDFNHPSVVMYSVGNEIPEIGTDHGAKICQMLGGKIKELDRTRYTLASINGVFAAGDKVDEIMADVAEKISADGTTDGNVNDFMTLIEGHLDDVVVHKRISERLERACAGIDIAGYNYMTARYETDGIEYPNRVIVGSETYPPEIARNWGLVEKLPHVIGDFTWTGWDYIGEAGVGIPAYQWGEGGFGAGFPAQLAYCGDLDITGFRRPASYFREVVFGLRKDPYISVQNPYRYGEFLIKTPWVLSDSVSSWTYDGCEGKPVIVEVYSGGDEVELFLNGRSLGRKAAGKKEGFITYFETEYHAGTLTAVTYENNRETGRMDLVTAGKDLVLAAEPEPEGKELIYIPIEIRDGSGTVASDQMVQLEVEVKGAELVGFGSANPKPVYNFTGTKTETFQGRALAILKRTGEGDITLNITGEGSLKAELFVANH